MDLCETSLDHLKVTFFALNKYLRKRVGHNGLARAG